MQEVTVVKGLQTEVIKLQVSIRFERGAKALEVKLEELLVQQIVLHTFLDELRKVFNIRFAQFSLGYILAQNLFGNGMKQQACSGIGVIRVLFYQRARCQDRRLVDLIHGDAVVQIAHGLSQNWFWANVGSEPGTG